MEFRILGPARGDRRTGGRLISAAHKQRTLLALLLLQREPGRLQRSPDRGALGGAIRRGRPQGAPGPRVAAAQAAGRGALETKAPGLSAAGRRDELDLGALRAPARRTDGSTRRSRCGAGPPLADFAYERFAQPRSRAWRSCASPVSRSASSEDLARGRHAELVGELEALVARAPAARAPARPAHARALSLRPPGGSAGGLPGRARRARRRARHRALPGVARASPADPRAGSCARRRAPRSRPAAREFRGFLRRARDASSTRCGLGSTTRFAGQGRLFLLAGEPGIGKSRLAEEGAANRPPARSAGPRRALLGGGRGARVLAVGAGAASVPPRARTGRASGRSSAPGQPTSLSSCPSCGSFSRTYPSRPAPESVGARIRLFDAIVAFLESIARERPLVVFFDDLHAADEPSLLLLRFVAREARRRGCCSSPRTATSTRRCATHSAPHSPSSCESRSSVASPSAVSRTTTLRITSPTSRASPPEARAVAAIHSETGGNPLFVGEIVRLLDSQGRLGAPIEALEIPPEIREVIGSRVARLTESCQKLLSLASVLGREFGVDVLQHLSSFPQEKLYDALDEAMTERIIGEVPANPNRLRFTHVLIRDTLTKSSPRPRRMQHHREAAAALEHVHASRARDHISQRSRSISLPPDPSPPGARSSMRGGRRISPRHLWRSRRRRVCTSWR